MYMCVLLIVKMFILVGIMIAHQMYSACAENFTLAEESSLTGNEPYFILGAVFGLALVGGVGYKIGF